MQKVNIYWSRRDFRLHDNPALFECLKKTKEEEALFLPLFILEDYMCEALPEYQFGFPSRYFLSKALPEFAKHFKNFTIIKGKGAQSIVDLRNVLQKTNEIEVFINEDIYIDFYKQIEKLKRSAVKVTVLNDGLSVSKEQKSGTNNYYSVFTPFKKAVWYDFLNVQILPKPNLHNINYFNAEILDHKIVHNNFESIWTTFSKKRLVQLGNTTLDIDKELDFLPDFETLENFYYTEESATKRFQKYLTEEMINYKEDRDSLEKDTTSKISLGLAWGLVSARSLREKVQEHFDNDFLTTDWHNVTEDLEGAVHFLSELIWREFYKYLFYRKPELMQTEFQEKFRGNLEWVENDLAMTRFEAWIRGKTGYKIVDAAMMQLAKTGWMHNRSRMIVASVLTKNLGVDWRWGQEYFRAMLLDLDEASNNGGWQWGASVGADPKPIRIFNPYLQAENYDKHNVYQKKWLGDDAFYSDLSPIIEHKVARAEALKRYKMQGEKEISPRDY